MELSGACGRSPVERAGGLASGLELNVSTIEQTAISGANSMEGISGVSSSAVTWNAAGDFQAWSRTEGTELVVQGVSRAERH